MSSAVGKDELLVWISTVSGRRCSRFEDLRDGAVLLKTIASIFPTQQPALTKIKFRIHPKTDGETKANWEAIKKAMTALKLPLQLFDRIGIIAARFECCYNLLAMLYFLHNLTLDLTFTGDFAHPFTPVLSSYLESTDCVLSLVIGGGIALQDLPDEVFELLKDQYAEALNLEPASVPTSTLDASDALSQGLSPPPAKKPPPPKHASSPNGPAHSTEDYDLWCVECLEFLVDPVGLECHHHLCRACVQRLLGSARLRMSDDTAELALRCAECAAVTPLALDGSLASLPPDPSVVSRLALADHHRSSEPIASEVPQTVACFECEERVAVLHCQQCDQTMCQPCSKNIHAHKMFQSHNPLPFVARRQDKHSTASAAYCPSHPKHVLDLFCTKERQVVCLYCMQVGSHQGHSAIPIEQAASDARQHVAAVAADLQQHQAELMELRSRVESRMEASESSCADISQQVIAHFDELHRRLQQRQAVVLARLEELRAETMGGFNQQLSSLGALIADTEHGVNLAATRLAQANDDGRADFDTLAVSPKILNRLEYLRLSTQAHKDEPSAHGQKFYLHVDPATEAQLVDTVAHVTASAPVPSTPEKLAVARSTPSSFTCSWKPAPQAVVGDSVPLVFVLEIKRSSDPKFRRVYEGEAAEFCIEGLDTLTPYRVRLCARNQYGCSLWTEVEAATTHTVVDVSSATSNMVIYAMGGHGEKTLNRSAERYEVRTNTWTTVESMNSRRNRIAAAALGGDVYVVGGFDGSNVLSTVEKLNTRSGKWTSAPSMSTKRYSAAAAVLPDTRASACAHEGSGFLYAIGGYGSGALNSVERFDGQKSGWSTMASMTVCRRGLAAVPLGGTAIYALGGQDGSGICNTAERYDAVVDKWTPVRPLLHNRYCCAAVALDAHSILAIGGYGAPPATLSSVEHFDTRAGKWTNIASMLAPRRGTAAVVADCGNVFVMGGGGTDGLNDRLCSVERFEPRANTWVAVAPMSVRREGLAAAAVPLEWLD